MRDHDAFCACIRTFFDPHPGWSLPPSNVVRSPIDDKPWLTARGWGDFFEWAHHEGWCSAQDAQRMTT
jgi:hypothetical protein